MAVEKFFAEETFGYEWSEFHVYVHPRNSRKFVVWSDSGCSCDGYIEPSAKDLEAEAPLTKREVYAKFSEWWSKDGLEKVRNLERLQASLTTK